VRVVPSPGHLRIVGAMRADGAGNQDGARPVRGQAAAEAIPAAKDDE
jgi:hypothetical protein